MRLSGTDWFQLQPSDDFSPSKEYGFEAIVTNDRLTLDDRPNDFDDRQWGLARVDAPDAWTQLSSEFRKDGPLVAILDTGVDIQHPDLAPNLWRNPGEIPGNGIDDDGNGYIDDVHGAQTTQAMDGDIQDAGEHGTHVAGIAAAKGDNGNGIAGTDWNGTILGVKIFDDNGNTDVASVIRGIEYAEAQDASIINCSWGGGAHNQALFEVMQSSSALFVCSAGNRGHDTDKAGHYPSGFELPNVISVAAANRNDGISFISNYGAESVDLAAPGVQILSTITGGAYEVKSGTSMAAPHVTGAAALVKRLLPDAGAEEIKAAILGGVDRLPQLQGKMSSGGRLNLSKALRRARLAKHGPKLLGDFFREFQDSVVDLKSRDNSSQDEDPRAGFLKLGPDRYILNDHQLVLSEGDGSNYVWLEGRQDGERFEMEQVAVEKYQGRYYSYPLHVEGPAETPYSPPDAEVVDQDVFTEARAEFVSAYSGAG